MTATSKPIPQQPLCVNCQKPAAYHEMYIGGNPQEGCSGFLTLRSKQDVEDLRNLKYKGVIKSYIKAFVSVGKFGDASIEAVTGLIYDKTLEVVDARERAIIKSAKETARKDFNKRYSGTPILHNVPCEDCGSKYWHDWYLPDAVFNSVCPGGNGYLCLPCFGKRMEKKGM
jgi:hypothetical protein